MCKSISLISNGRGKIYFFDLKIRQELEKLNPEKYNYDSHTSIASYFKVDEDRFNKYEYNVFTKHFEIDQINTRDDSDKIKKFCKKDWSDIIDSGLMDYNLKGYDKPFTLKAKTSGNIDLRGYAHNFNAPDMKR